MPMSQMQSGSEPPNDETSTGATGSLNGRLFRSLRETAKMHDVSPSYLSRRVRAGKAAKGHDLCPYVLFEKKDGQKKIFGFAFPPDYEFRDSAVDGTERERPPESSEKGSSTGAVPQEENRSRSGEPQAPSPDGSAPEDSPDGLSKKVVDDLKEDLGELKSAIDRLGKAIGRVAQESIDRQKRIEREVTDTADELQEWRRQEKEKLWGLRRWLRGRFEQERESRMENAEIVDQQFDKLNERISRLREWVETVVDGAQEDLERSREQDFEDLSAELQEEIREPILEILADDDQDENLWGNALGFMAVLAAVEVLDKRPDLVARAAHALGGNSTTGKVPLPTSGVGGQGESNTQAPGFEQEGEGGNESTRSSN